jgi:hypothetical protein
MGGRQPRRRETAAENAHLTLQSAAKLNIHLEKSAQGGVSNFSPIFIWLTINTLKTHPWRGAKTPPGYYGLRDSAYTISV